MNIYMRKSDGNFYLKLWILVSFILDISINEKGLVKMIYNDRDDNHHGYCWNFVGCFDWGVYNSI